MVEKKNARTGEWEKVGQPLGTSFRVRGLQNGVAYDFRVRAENQYGVSEPLGKIRFSRLLEDTNFFLTFRCRQFGCRQEPIW